MEMPKKLQPAFHRVESKTFLIPKFLVKFSSTYFKRSTKKNLSEKELNENAPKKRCAKAKKQKHFQKSFSVDNRNLKKLLPISLPVVEEFKKMISGFRPSLNSASRLILNQSSRPVNSLKSIKLQQNKEAGKNEALFVLNNNDIKHLKLDVSCVNIDLKENNYHHFPREETLKKPDRKSKVLENNKRGRAEFGKRRKGRSKSLELIPNEEIKLSSTERKGKSPDKNLESYGNSSNHGQTNCMLCCEKASDAVLMECGHGGICYECAVELLKKLGECHLCRKVLFFVKIFHLAAED